MKNTFVVAIAVLLFAGLAYGAASHSATVVTVSAGVSAVSTPVCNTQTPCIHASAAIVPGEGSPMPLCRPGHCGGQVRQIAGEGSPMPLCRPGHCGDGTVRQIAGEGSPMPLCRPGHCGGQVREIAEGSPTLFWQNGHNWSNELRPAVAL